MKNILSIDVDWVTSWNDYKQLTRTVAPWIKRGKFKRVSFGSTHDKIAPVIDSFDEPIHIVNVDHHHDWEYDNCPLEMGYKFCNWLGWYASKDKIERVTWVANPNSDMGIRKGKYSIESYMDIYFDLDVINQYEYEALFVCQSPGHIEHNWAAHATYETFQLVSKLTYEE